MTEHRYEWFDIQRGPGDCSTKGMEIPETLSCGCIVQVVEILNGQSATALVFVPLSKALLTQGQKWERLMETPADLPFKKRTERMEFHHFTLYKVVEFWNRLTVAVCCVTKSAPLLNAVEGRN